MTSVSDIKNSWNKRLIWPAGFSQSGLESRALWEKLAHSVLEAAPIVADQEAGNERQESTAMYHLHRPMSKDMHPISRLLKVYPSLPPEYDHK